MNMDKEGGGGNPKCLGLEIKCSRIFEGHTWTARDQNIPKHHSDQNTLNSNRFVSLE